MFKALSPIADLIQVGTFLNFDKLSGVENLTGFILLLSLIFWYTTNSRKNGIIAQMQSEIDRMAGENRVLREDALQKRGLNKKEIKKLFPPNDGLKTLKRKVKWWQIFRR